MSLFVIGDTHFSFGTDKPMDIFHGWQNYEERLKNKWNSIVDDDDFVVIAGDISWAMSLEDAEADFRFINDELKGKKIIMKGNHDYWWNTKKKMDTFLHEKGFNSISILHNNSYRAGDFSVCGTRGWFFDCEKDKDMKVLLRESSRLRTSIREGKKQGGEPIVFLHYPPISNDAECVEITNVLHDEEISRCYYAHLHGPSVLTAVNGVKDGIKYSLVSGDFLEFCPKLVEKF